MFPSTMSMCSACGTLGKPRHTEYFACNGNKHFRAVIDDDVLDVELESC